MRYDPLSRDKTNPSICAEQASVAEQELCFARNGVVRAMEVCKEQFKKERWNCPETSFIPLLEAAASKRHVVLACTVDTVGHACVGWEQGCKEEEV